MAKGEDLSLDPDLLVRVLDRYDVEELLELLDLTVEELCEAFPLKITRLEKKGMLDV